MMSALVRPRPKRRSTLLAEINVVPYIDVTLVLLIIFMITAPLLSQGVEVDLPQATSEALAREDKEPIVVSVDKDGVYYINIGENQDQGIDADEIRSRVQIVLRHQPETSVMVRGDREVDYGKVVTLMSLLQSAGVPNVGLITEAPQEP